MTYNEDMRENLEEKGWGLSAKFSVRKKSESIWMLPGYMDGIREAGGLPVISPFPQMSRN